jgi:hypothetical protein
MAALVNRTISPVPQTFEFERIPRIAESFGNRRKSVLIRA